MYIVDRDNSVYFVGKHILFFFFQSALVFLELIIITLCAQEGTSDFFN